MIVTVQDAQGKPVEGATVTATNNVSGKQINATTRADGTTSGITQELGAGTATVRASLGTRVSDTKQVSWSCGECACNADPGFLVLVLGG